MLIFFLTKAPEEAAHPLIGIYGEEEEDEEGERLEKAGEGWNLQVIEEQDQHLKRGVWPVS